MAKRLWLQVVGGVIIIFVGALMVSSVFRKGGDEPFEVLEEPTESPDSEEYEEYMDVSEDALPTYSKSFVLGVSLGTAGISCVFPILTAVITAISTSADKVGGFFALFLYAFGMIIPFIFIGLALGKINEILVLKLAKIFTKLQVIFGAVLIGLGIYFAYDALIRII